MSIDDRSVAISSLWSGPGDHRIGRPKDLCCGTYQRADLRCPSRARSTSPARTGFKCMSSSFSSTFAGDQMLKPSSRACRIGSEESRSDQSFGKESLNTDFHVFEVNAFHLFINGLI